MFAQEYTSGIYICIISQIPSEPNRQLIINTHHHSNIKWAQCLNCETNIMCTVINHTALNCVTESIDKRLPIRILYVWWCTWIKLCECILNTRYSKANIINLFYEDKNKLKQSHIRIDASLRPHLGRVHVCVCMLRVYRVGVNWDGLTFDYVFHFRYNFIKIYRRCFTSAMTINSCWMNRIWKLIYRYYEHLNINGIT